VAAVYLAEIVIIFICGLVLIVSGKRQVQSFQLYLVLVTSTVCLQQF